MREEIYEIMRKWLWLEDEEGIDIVLATAIASMYPGEPLWMFIIDVPSGGKTEICNSLSSSPFIYAVDSLTPQALSSGFRKKDGSRADIIEDMNGKLVVIKDFTTILQKPQATREELLGRLRRAYDGELDIAYGSGVGRQKRRSKFGILAAVTNAIDDFVTVHTLLGERFLRVRPRFDDYNMAKSAMKHSGSETLMRQEISEATNATLKMLSLQTGKLPLLGDDTIEQVYALARITATLRTPVPRDHYKHRVISMPYPEKSSRLSKQYERLAQSLFVLGNYTYHHLVRVCEDTVPKLKLDIVRKLMTTESMTTGELLKGYETPRYLLLNQTEDLWLLKVIDRKLTGATNDDEAETGKKTYVHSLKPEFRKLMKIAELWKQGGQDD